MSIIIISIIILLIISYSDSCHIHHHQQRFDQKNKRFWEFNQQSDTWVELKLPYNLLSCIDNNCTVVNSIKQQREVEEQTLPLRKRVSVTKLSETSIWVTGESGSIYERFWNGLHWVVAPHDLPLSAVSVFFVNHTILALSDGGLLYQMQLNEESQPIWVEFKPQFEMTKTTEPLQLSFGLVSNDRERMYFGTKKGLLLELVGVDPPRWENHGRPPGANVSAITDAATITQGLLLIVSAAGDLYEYDRTSKPPWKKHIHAQGTKKYSWLASSRACMLHGLIAPHSVSLFLLTKGGELIERRLHRRKWNWVVHGKPEGHQLSSITCVFQDSHSKSLLFTTVAGFVFEYQFQDVEERWVNHKHPPHAKAARGIAGVSLQEGRTIFALDDGRLSELHLSGLGGESLGPNSPISTRRKSMLKYVWSLIDAPETEGWNTEYCTEERGPSNCILGTKEASSLAPRWRKDSRTQQNYLSPSASDGGTLSSYNGTLNRRLFRLRLMQESKAFFFITDNDLTFEYLNTEDNAWFWLRHHHSTGIQGAIANYNGSLFVVDEHGSLLIRERSSSDLAWINCTSMRKGRQVIAGPPWDGIPGLPLRAKPEDAIFLVSTTGRLLQFTVVLKKYKWKDCKHPPGIKIASIVDQEGFRDNIVFVTGQNGRLYQYNKVTHLWHQHYQSQHLVLSTSSSGTAMRPSMPSLRGSLFMLSEDGGLVEYQWSSTEGWNWIEHGTPCTNVTLVGAPGPCFGGSQLFLIGSDGSVYLRYSDRGEWKWSNCGFPYDGNRECLDKDFADNIKGKSHMDKYCNPKVSSTRPIPFDQDSVIFELQDGRLGEMKRMEDKNWIWSRTIGTPTSLCIDNLWTSSAT